MTFPYAMKFIKFRSKVMMVMMIIRISLHICISQHFSEFLCISLHFSPFLCISRHFSTFVFISLHFSKFLCISPRISSFLYISLHFSVFIYISLHFSALLYISLNFSKYLYIYPFSCWELSSKETCSALKLASDSDRAAPSPQQPENQYRLYVVIGGVCLFVVFISLLSLTIQPNKF